MSLLAEIKRRNVFKIAVAYAAVSWLLIQLAALLEDSLALPAWFDAFVIVSLALGFPVALILAWAFELTPEGIRPTASSRSATSAKPAGSGRLAQATIVVLSLAVVVLILDNYVLTEQREASVAILPFVAIGGGEEQQRFADGIVRELNLSLTRVDDLIVIETASSMTYRDSDKTAQQIAAELGVEYLIRGSFEDLGDTIRVVASLIRGSDGANEWVEPYDRELNDPQAIVRGIAEAVAERLSATFGIGDFDVDRGGTDVIEAYDHYVLAQGWVQQGAFIGNLNNAINEYQRALELDNDFGLAELGLAETGVDMLRNLGFTVDSEIPPGLPEERRAELAEFQTFTRAAVERARAIVPDHAALLAIDAMRHFDRLEWLQVEETYRARLSRTGPSDFPGNLGLGSFLVQTGRARESLRYLERAHTLNPLVAEPLVWLALAHDVLGEPETAVSLNEEARSLLGYATLGEMARAWRLLARGESDAASRSLIDTNWEGALEELAAQYESIAAGELAFRELPLRTLSANIGMMAAALGDPDVAIEIWRWGLPRAPIFLLWSWTPLMEDVRRHPDFELLIRELGLPAYWRASSWPEHCRESDVESFECD